VGLIYLDACLAIYLVEQHPEWAEPLERAMMAQIGAASFAISPLVKCECLVGPIKRADPALQRDYVEFFEQHLSLSMPEPVYLQAAELRARFGLRTPDALHLACAQHHRCDALWTNDDRLSRASRGIARNVLGAGPPEASG
jgi:predicted nucleic acid-binding protein